MAGRTVNPSRNPSFATLIHYPLIPAKAGIQPTMQRKCGNRCRLQQSHLAQLAFDGAAVERLQQVFVGSGAERLGDGQKVQVASRSQVVAGVTSTAAKPPG